MLTIFLAFVQPIFHAFCDVMQSRLVNKVFTGPAVITLWFTQAVLFISVPLLLIFFGTPGSISLTYAALIALALVIDITFMSLYIYVMKIMDISISQAIWNLGGAAVPFLALAIFGERLSNGALLGFFMLVAAVTCLGIEDFKRPKLKFGKGFWLMIIVAALYESWLLLQKYIISQIGWLNMAFYYRLAWLSSVALFFISAYGRKEVLSNWKPFKKNLKHFSLYALASTAGFFSTMFALGALPLAVREGISTTQVFFVLAWAWVFSLLGICGAREDIRPASVVKKVICFSMMTIGLVLLV